MRPSSHTAAAGGRDAQEDILIGGLLAMLVACNKTKSEVRAAPAGIGIETETGDELLEVVVAENVLVQIEHLRTQPAVPQNKRGNLRPWS